MLRAARAILGSDDLAWDAVQEALLRVWRLGERAPGPALRRLATLSALHLSRCQRRRRFHEERAPAGEICCAQDPLVDLASSAQRQALRAALARITRAQREVFELYEFHGRDYRQIADALAVPIGTVRSRLARARRELRAHLPAHEAPPRRALPLLPPPPPLRVLRVSPPPPRALRATFSSHPRAERRDRGEQTRGDQ
jgi:RNA polymerase sigma-70 factor (ECF subfamily)